MASKYLKKLIESEVGKIFTSLKEEKLEEEQLEEGGYAKLVRSLAGLEPSIDSIGIITAENPMAQELSPKANKKRNRELARKLREMGYGFYQVQGKYGNVEKPLVVPNITKEDIIKLGNEFEQDSVIFVEKTPEGSLAQLIETHGEHATEKSSVILPLAQDVEDFYTLYKGRKFIIPFFDDVFQNKQLIQGRVVDIN